VDSKVLVPLKWSIALMVTGVLIGILGFIPLYAYGITIFTLESAASVIAIGLLVFLIGLLIRRATKVFKTLF
jgi:hypothetical protein